MTRTAVVDAALDVVDRHGLESLTVRKVATELGASPMAIYWHVQNKAELVDAMGDRICESIEITVDDTAPWWEQLRTLLDDFLRALRTHPGGAQIVVPRLLFSSSGREALELNLQLLRSAGFSTPDATQLARQGVRVAISLVTEPLFTGVEVDEERARSIERDVEATMQALDPGRFPNILAARGALSDASAEREFEKLGLDTYVAGVRALAAQP